MFRLSELELPSYYYQSKSNNTDIVFSRNLICKRMEQLCHRSSVNASGKLIMLCCKQHFWKYTVKEWQFWVV